MLSDCILQCFEILINYCLKGQEYPQKDSKGEGEARRNKEIKEFG